VLKVLSIAAVVVSAAVFAYAAPPLGCIFQLGTLEILAATVAGTVLGSYALVYASEWIVSRLMAAVYRALGRPVPDRSPTPGWMHDAIDRFGAPGLGLIGPLTIGLLAAGVLVPVLGIPKARGALWLAVGSSATFGLYALLVIYAAKMV
jgi:hypothetical protein